MLCLILMRLILMLNFEVIKFVHFYVNNFFGEFSSQLLHQIRN
jgi:hypothetical protein